MKGLPPEIDELMWTIAESDDIAAIDEFGDRYPAYRGELGKRLQMVRSLRGARPQAAKAKAQTKRFVPSSTGVVYREQSRWMMPTAAVFVLMSVVFATYAVTTYAQRGQPKPTEVVQQPITAPDPTESVAGTGEPLTPPISTAQNDPVTPPPAADRPNPFDQPVTVVADRISLANALNLIARQIGVTLTSAPGMPDVEIAVDYRNVAASQVLADLGRNFGFTPMIQSEREALLIPAVDPTNGDSPRPPSGSSAEFDLTGPGTSRSENP